MGSFAILTALKRHLGTDSGLLKEVLETKTGYALCTESVQALQALETRSNDISTVLTDCTVEKPAVWTTYRLTGIL